MPKFFAKVPFWIWTIFGLIFLALSVPGFIEGEERKARQAALLTPIPELVDLEDFDATADLGPVGEINVFAQTHPDYRFLVDGIGVSGGSAIMVPLFSAYSGPGEKSVGYVILADDPDQMDVWFEQSLTGTARMGELFEINGEVIDGQGFTAAIRVTLRDAGLDQVDPLVIVKPFTTGRVSALSAPTRATYGSPIILAASGVWMIWFGFVVMSRVKAHKKSLRRRMGEIGVRTSDEGSLNLSRLQRKSKQLASGATIAAKADGQGPLDPSATPAE